ncbi:hypothetical protein QZH41_014296 [Actinostola sp. cb2023]|nr:hypothetical protein QZH41_014296 [Actinostola sp. cb2023]
MSWLTSCSSTFISSVYVLAERNMFLTLFLFWLFMLVNCFCYTFNTDMKNWNNSNKDCINNGGSLVSMETEDEWKFINDKIQNINVSDKVADNEWYIGLTKTTGEWRWISGQSLTINKWQRGKADDNVKEQHVVMAKNYPAGTYGLFNNLQSYIPKPYICEYSNGNINTFDIL